jgi:hypothetical protein
MLAECKSRAARRPVVRTQARQPAVDLARLLVRAGRPIQASALIAQPTAELDAAAAQPGSNVHYDLVRPLFESGLALCEAGRALEGKQVVFRAVELCESLARLKPGPPRAAADRAAIFLDVAQALGPYTATAQLVPWAERAIDAYGLLPDKRDELAGALVVKADLLVRAGRAADAIEPARRALAIRESLAERVPDDLAAADRLAIPCIALAEPSDRPERPRSQLPPTRAQQRFSTPPAEPSLKRRSTPVNSPTPGLVKAQRGVMPAT